MRLTLALAVGGLAWSYGAATVAAGPLEPEPISTVELPRGGDPDWTHEIELEYGITSSLEGGLYLVSKQDGAGPLRFAGYEARLRYRPLALGTLAVDLAVYLEYIGSPTLESHGGELKLIAARQGKALRAALNATFELERGPAVVGGCAFDRRVFACRCRHPCYARTGLVRENCALSPPMHRQRGLSASPCEGTERP